MKKVLLLISLITLFVIGLLVSTNVKEAHANPTKYCYWNPILGDCDTGGQMVCYDIHPPDCYTGP